jgi:hypothetical protein
MMGYENNIVTDEPLIVAISGAIGLPNIYESGRSPTGFLTGFLQQI